jgi:hypothetical protein
LLTVSAYRFTVWRFEYWHFMVVTGAVWDLLTDKRVRLLVISFSILHAAQQLSGINAVFYYSTSFFKGIVANPLVGTAAAGTVNVIATYAALKLMDR